jgi:hypothetical protein
MVIGGCEPTTQKPVVKNPDKTPSRGIPSTSKAKPVAPEKNVGFASDLQIIAWNLESEGNHPKVIAKQISELPKSDIYAFNEVDFLNFDLYQQACGKNFEAIRSKSGGKDRLQICFNADRFELVRRLELDEINPELRYRSPLVAHLKEKSSGYEFMVMTNHLARGKAEKRQKQAQWLVDWARDQTLPIVAIGDFNFDFVFDTNTGNEAFKIFVRDGIWKWVRPEKLIDSNWFDPEPDGIDNYIDSILDFAFVAGPAKDWIATSDVIVREGDFPDDDQTSDHRPIRLKISAQQP